MKKLMLISLFLIFIVVPRFAFTQSEYSGTIKSSPQKITFEEREELVMASRDSLLQPQNQRMFVRREYVGDERYFVFYTRDSTGKWNEFDRIEYVFEDTYIDRIFFDGESGIVLGSSRRNTRYFYWVRNDQGWSVKMRD